MTNTKALAHIVKRLRCAAASSARHAKLGLFCRVLSCLPTASALPHKKKDFGTSCWQL
jgi:hypothetical protein